MIKFKHMLPELILSLLLIWMPDILFGLVLLIVPRTAAKNRQKHCNVQLIARCIRIDNNSTPILEYNYHGIEREVRSKDKNIEVGNQRIVWVNPNNPYEYILEGEKSSTVTVCTIIGAFALIGSVMIIATILRIAAMTTN